MLIKIEKIASFLVLVITNKLFVHEMHNKEEEEGRGWGGEVISALISCYKGPPTIHYFTNWWFFLVEILADLSVYCLNFPCLKTNYSSKNCMTPKTLFFQRTCCETFFSLYTWTPLLQNHLENPKPRSQTLALSSFTRHSLTARLQKAQPLWSRLQLLWQNKQFSPPWIWLLVR